MAESVYKVIELIGTSKESWQKAADAAITRARKSLRDLRVAEVVKLDLQLDAKGEVEAYRAKLNVSFKFEELMQARRVGKGATADKSPCLPTSRDRFVIARSESDEAIHLSLRRNDGHASLRSQ